MFGLRLSLLLLFGIKLGLATTNYKPLSDDCSCGYYIAETNLFLTNRITLNTTDFPDGTTPESLLDLINKQGWTIDVDLLDNEPQKTNYTIDNIAWDASVKAVAMKVSGDPSTTDPINSAELASIDMSMRYGSFRYTVKMSSVPGACHGLFIFKDNDDEIDIEVTTRWMYSTNDTIAHPDGLLYTIQSVKGQTMNHPFSFDPAQDFHEYRFDWQDGKVNYYTDGNHYNALDGWTPGAGWKNGDGSQIVINNWSDGDGNWTGLAPIQDNIMLLQRLEGFYNSTNSSINAAFTDACSASSDKRVCLVQGTQDQQTTTNSTTSNSTFTPTASTTISSSTSKSSSTRSSSHMSLTLLFLVLLSASLSKTVLQL